jgi:iron complex outermembrane receptor protein
VQNGPYTFYGNYVPATVQSETKGFFAEFTLPILDTLNVDVAIRHEIIGHVGSTTNPTAALRWQALDWFALRGSVGTTFRAPPGATLIPAAVTGLAYTSQAGRYTPFDTWGNPNLKPEKATTYNLGAIFTAGAFTSTIDYWNFDFSNPLTAESGLNVLNAIFPAGAPNNCANPAYAALVARVTFASGVCAPTNIIRTKVFDINGAPVHTSGIDLSADYLFDDVPYVGGTLDAHLDGTYTLRYHVGSQLVEGIAVTPAYDAAGKLNYLLSVSSLPNWKGNFTLNFDSGPHSLQIAEHYVGGMTDQRTTIFAGTTNALGLPNTNAGKRIGAFITTDLYYKYNWTDQNLSFNAAIVNLFDQDPPFARLDYSYDPFTANPLGRTFKIGLTVNY